MGAPATVLPFRAEPEVLRELVEAEYSAAGAARQQAEAAERRAQLVDELATMRTRDLRSAEARRQRDLRDAELMSAEEVTKAIAAAGVSRSRFWELAHEHGWAVRSAGARARVRRAAFHNWLLSR